MIRHTAVAPGQTRQSSVPYGPSVSRCVAHSRRLGIGPGRVAGAQQRSTRTAAASKTEGARSGGLLENIVSGLGNIADAVLDAGTERLIREFGEADLLSVRCKLSAAEQRQGELAQQLRAAGAGPRAMALLEAYAAAQRDRNNALARAHQQAYQDEARRRGAKAQGKDAGGQQRGASGGFASYPPELRFLAELTRTKYAASLVEFAAPDMPSLPPLEGPGQQQPPAEGLLRLCGLALEAAVAGDGALPEPSAVPAGFFSADCIR